MSWATAFALRQYTIACLWIVPLLGIALGSLLAEAAVALDGAVRVPAEWRYSPSTASSVLSSIVGAMVALLGFVVTIGILVVQQATGTLSPRYMRLWYRDRLQKAVLATFTGTFSFAFSLLRSIETDFVPDLGVTLAGAAVAVSLVLLLMYLNRFIHNLRPVAIAALVARAGRRVIHQGALLAASGALDRADAPRAPEGPVTRVPSAAGGALQGFAPERLAALAERYDCLVVLAHPVGDFVPPGVTLFEVHGSTPPPARELTGLVALGVERTIEQDPAFGLRVLVDIAIRALSPAVNDPTTAVQVLNHIEAFLHTLGRLELSGRYTLRDARGVPRLRVPGRSWEDFLQLAVTEIREYGAGSLQVCRRLRALFDGLLAAGLPERHLAAVRTELRLLDASVEARYPDPARRAAALTPDRQGIGGGAGTRA
ncbi:DUF2254 domain-containing protein [Streptomyces spongiicola]|uniref:DUF2254 domain-containing protein n=1 Tax=Streptomyces spongiicola TaxID=1690221 RepID=A0A2S1Z6T5_9ACTN|nr:DUF2254 domain-containing protein [Streptomyces spongiicola]AWK12040.1 DUF2254 domain-containing protein [Streptomyces spongiicola]GBP99128.1 DUF2254 domain-containing protein [Streptomyces spongiicola]